MNLKLWANASDTFLLCRNYAGALRDLPLAKFAIEIIPVSARQASLARKAFQRFGRGRHPARLNFGDCFAYALAKDHSAPLLFKGKDFSQTDIAVAPY